MRKSGAKREVRVKSYLLLPEQVAKYVTPLHAGLVLLPLWLFSKDHANHLAMVVNLVSVDSADTGHDMAHVVEEVAAVIRAMFERVKQGRRWNVTAEEREVLRSGIVQFDKYMRTWTSGRLLAASTKIATRNEYFKARGGKFLDWVPLEKEMV